MISAAAIAAGAAATLVIFSGGSNTMGTRQGAESVVRAGKPVTQRIAATSPTAGAKRAVVVLFVTGYTPPPDGTVEIVVSAKADAATGAAAEIGRFAMFPDQPMRAKTPESAKQFAFEFKDCPASAAPCGLSVEVALTPLAGKIEGAELVLGMPRIEWR